MSYDRRVTSGGFASMDVEKQREIARKGRRAVAPQARSFSSNRRLASEAGRKGGQAAQRKRVERSGRS